MHVLAISTVTDNDRYWSALKRAHGRMPQRSAWVLAIASTDGTKAVNVIAHDDLDEVRAWFDEHTTAFATTEFTEADAANAVGLK